MAIVVTLGAAVSALASVLVLSVTEDEAVLRDAELARAVEEEAPRPEGAPGGDVVTPPKPPHRSNSAMDSGPSGGDGASGAAAVVPERSPDDDNPDVTHSRMRVLDQSDQPIAGARIENRGGLAETDAEGIALVPFRWSGAGHGSPTSQELANMIHITAEGFAATEVSAGFEWPAVVWLHRARHVSGRCIDAAGAPVAGVSIGLKAEGWSNGPEIRLTTDPQGRFRSHELAPQEYGLTVIDRCWIARPHRIVPPDEDIVVLVFRPARVQGRLEVYVPGGDRRGSRRSLSETFELRTSPEGRRVHVDYDGIFAFDCVPGLVTVGCGEQELGRFFLREGEQRTGLSLVLCVAGVASKEERSATQDSDADAVPIDLLLRGREEHTAAIFAYDAARGLRVIASRLQASGMPQTVRCPLPRPAWLAADSSAAGCMQRAVPDPACPVHLDIERTARVCGSVVDDRGRPVAHGYVAVRWAGTRWRVRTASTQWRMRPPGETHHQYSRYSRSGQFSIARIGPGCYDLVWGTRHDPGDRAMLCRALRMPEPPRDIDVGVLVVDARSTRVQVRVIDATGGPVPRAIVRLREGRFVRMAARADLAGLAEFHTADPYELEVEASDPGFGTASASLPARAPGTAEGYSITLRLAPSEVESEQAQPR
ncbi:MAG: carboxypeptidase regulatory-like domain-containing protein [Planctomycetes bacterium]|nr:carboxypeptidase regulatory-like domain-containing protein [Planctomycetota bacterium]